MNYEIERRKECVIVRLVGRVRAADLLRAHEECEFLLGLETTSTAIYDYSNAGSVDISLSEVRTLAGLANHVARFQSPLTIIIVPRIPSSTRLAEAYCTSVTAKGVTTFVAKNTDQALQKAGVI